MASQSALGWYSKVCSRISLKQFQTILQNAPRLPFIQNWFTAFASVKTASRCSICPLSRSSSSLLVQASKMTVLGFQFFTVQIWSKTPNTSLSKIPNTWLSKAPNTWLSKALNTPLFTLPNLSLFNSSKSNCYPWSKFHRWLVSKGSQVRASQMKAIGLCCKVTHKRFLIRAPTEDCLSELPQKTVTSRNEAHMLYRSEVYSSRSSLYRVSIMVTGHCFGPSTEDLPQVEVYDTSKK